MGKGRCLDCKETYTSKELTQGYCNECSIKRLYLESIGGPKLVEAVYLLKRILKDNYDLSNDHEIDTSLRDHTHIFLKTLNEN